MKKILAVLVTLTILASLFAPIVVNAAEAETDLVFEIGEISYNSDSGEIAVPILLAENYSNIYSARIVLLNEQGLECTNVVGGDLTQYYYTEYGEKIVIAPTYSVNPKGNMLIIREKSGYGFSETGCVGTFYFAADESFSEADLYNYTFYFGEATTITSAEGNALSFELKGKETADCEHWNIYEEIVIEPTYESDGIKHIICADCGMVNKEIIPALQVPVETEPAVCYHFACFEEVVIAPTYESEGIIRTICSDCYEVLSEETVPALPSPVEPDVCEHGETVEHIVKEANCIEEGIKEIVCVYCKEVVLTEIIMPSEHIFEPAPEKDQAPTCTEPGYTAYMCYSCGEMMTEEVPPTKHVKTYEEIVREPDIGVEGLKNIVCAICREVVATETIPAIDDTVEPRPEEPPVAEPVDAQLIFEIGKVTYNAQYGEIEVPIYLSENYKDIYAGEIELYSEQGLECSAILDGTIKDTYESYASNGIVEIVEYGFNYTPNPKLSRLIIDSSSGDHGVTSTGLVATFCYKVNDDFTAESINEYTFVFSENTTFVAIDLSKPSFVLTKSVTEECAHLNTEEIFETAPTCSAGGVSNIVCVDCGSIVGKNLLAPTGHDFIPSPENSKEPTCTTAGYVAYVCVVCGEIKTEGMVSLGHNKTYEEIVREPAIGVEGLKNIICGICGEVVRTETIPAIETPVEPEPEDPPVVEPVDAQLIFEIGEVTYNAQYGEIEVPLYLAENHKDIYAGEIELYSEQGLECTAIIEGTIKDEIDKGGRVGIVEFGFNYTLNPQLSRVIIDSAEPTSGITTTGLVATFCYKVNDDFTAESINEYTFVLSSETLFVAFDLSNPTYALRERVIEECEHVNVNEVLLIAPTCTAEGVMNTVCADCGEVVSKKTIPIINHMYKTVADKYIEPTCTLEGREVSRCINCGDEVIQTLPPLGHGETVEVVVKEPAVGVEGLKEIRCSVCGEVLETIILPALDNPEPPVETDVIFELGRLVYNEEYGEIEVPLYVVENNKDIYTAQVVLLSQQGLECTAILSGTIKDYFDKGGREGVVEYGFSYTVNPTKNFLLIDSTEVTRGITSTGLLATFCFKVPDNFKITDLAELEFALGDNMIIAFDGTYLNEELRETYYCYHFETEEVIVKAATCTENGLKNIVCSACAEVISSVEIEATGHNFEHYAEGDVAPTCTEAGKVAYKCHCSEMKYEVGAPAKGHTYKLNDGLTCVDCKHSKKPAKVEVLEVTSDSVTLAEKTYLEYSIDGVNWQSSGVFEGLEAETEYTFYSRVAASNVADVSEASEGVTVTTEAEYAPGDINGDGGVNAADLRLLKMLIAQQIPLDHPDVKNTEVDNISGMPNASDLRVIKLLIAQLY